MAELKNCLFFIANLKCKVWRFSYTRDIRLYSSYIRTYYIYNNDVPLSKIYNDDDSMARNGRVARRKLTRTFNFLEKAQCDNDNARSAVSQHTRDTRRE